MSLARIRRFAPLLLAAGLAGCGVQAAPPPSRPEAPEPIAIESVPDGVLAVARKTWPGVTFEEAWTESESDGELTYEVRGRSATGKVREVKVSADGRLLEKE